jgi:hypothetical protein
MSLLKANGVQFGQSGTATNNFTLSVPSSPDGTIKLARGNSGATTQDILSVNSSGAVTINNLNNQSFRNRIINGDMRIDQRNGGASQSITAGSAPYSVDRFIVRSAGGTITGQRVAGTGSTQYVYQITGGASVTQVQFEQRIEASNSYDLAGGNATLSVNLSNSLLATANWVLYYPTATDNFTSSTVISSGSWTISSTIARYNATISIPAAATTGLYLIIYVTAQTSGTFKIGDVQLEAGSTATEFERRPIGTELALCQRYYQQYNALQLYSPIAVGSWFSSTRMLAVMTLPTPMRSTPTINNSGFVAWSGANAYGTPTFSNPVNASGVSGLGVNTIEIDVETPGASGADRNAGLFKAANNSSAKFSLSSEL